MPKLENVFKGTLHKRLVFHGFKLDGVKKAWQEDEQFNWEQHYQSNPVQGLSPVDVQTGLAHFYGSDIDKYFSKGKNTPEDDRKFAQKIFSKIGCEFDVIKTMQGRYRVIGTVPGGDDAEEIKRLAEELDKRINEIGYKTDSGAKVPSEFNFESKAPGRFLYMPYHSAKKYNGGNATGEIFESYAITPGGIKLRKEQYEFRLDYKDEPMIVAMVGMQGQGDLEYKPENDEEEIKGGSRHKALWCVALRNKVYPEKDPIDLEEINRNFLVPMKPKEFQDCVRHITKRMALEKYDKDYYLNGIPKWCKECVGVAPFISDNFEDEVEEEAVETLVYNQIHKNFINTKDLRFLDKQQLNDWHKATHKGRLPFSEKLLKNKETKKVHSYLTHPRYPQGIVEIGYNEIKGIAPGTYFNRYQPSPYEDTPGDIDWFLRYYEKLLGPQNFELFCDYVALPFQYPGFKSQHAYLWISPQGVGKDKFAETMSASLGHDNVKVNVPFDKLVNDHSTLIDGTQLMFLNELNISNKRIEGKILNNKLKPFITNDTALLNPKNLKEVVVPNFCNFWMFSNDDVPIKLERGDRRIGIIKCAIKKEEIDAIKFPVMKRISEELHVNPGPFIHYFKNEYKLKDVSKFLKDAPMTEEKAELLDLALDSIDNKLDNAFQEREFPFANREYDDARGLGDNKGENSSFEYVGMFAYSDFERLLSFDPEFRKNVTYWDPQILKVWMRENSMLWPNGERTKKIKLQNGRYKRVFLFHNLQLAEDGYKMETCRPITSLTEGELGKLYERGILSIREQNDHSIDIIKDVEKDKK